MKKTLSLFLAVMMIFGCMSITAFAEEAAIDYGVYFGNQEIYVTSENKNDVLGDADGDAATVTFDPETYTFTFNNVNTDSVNFASHIWASEGYQDKSFKIKLIGENTLGSIIANDPVEIIGDGSLNLIQLNRGENVTVGMTGTLNITGSWAGATVVEGCFTVKEGAGKITIRHMDRSEYAYLAAMYQSDDDPNNKVTLPDGYKMVGSTDENVTDETVMSDNITYGLYGAVMVNGDFARSIVIYSTQSNDSTTKITANVPKMSYTIIIPSETVLTEDAHTDVLLGGESGKASITVDAHGSEKETVYYTVDLANADLSDGDGHTISTSYTYAQGGAYSELTADTKVTVYTGGNVVDSTIKVNANDTEWMAAPSGDYTASVVFNFVKEDVVLK